MRMATDARDSRHISEAGGLMTSKQPRTSKESSASGAARARRSMSRAPSEDATPARPPRERPQHSPVPADAVPGLVACTRFEEPPLPEQQARPLFSLTFCDDIF